jgi:hypothetical protein
MAPPTAHPTARRVRREARETGREQSRHRAPGLLNHSDLVSLAGYAKLAQLLIPVTLELAVAPGSIYASPTAVLAANILRMAQRRDLDISPERAWSAPHAQPGTQAEF